LSFRKRKRGTPLQIGQPFPVSQKKQLPARIRGSRFQQLRPIIERRLLLNFRNADEAHAFFNRYTEHGPTGDFLAPETLQVLKNQVIIGWAAEDMEPAGSITQMVDDFKRAKWFGLEPVRYWTANVR